MENTKKITGTIFNIQRFSIHDGPGIRTLVFMKGCPLRCRWCSNPEGLTSGLSVLSNTNVCIGCGLCSQFCKNGAIFQQSDGSYQIDRETCVSCLSCAKVCPANSKTISGEVKTVEQVLTMIEKDRMFYRHSGGGLTVGGGEMLAQPEFVCRLLAAAREQGLNTAVETSGYGSLDWLLKIADQCDTVHYDIKAFDSQLHKDLTRVDNTMILHNLKALSAHLAGLADNGRPELIIRLPLIVGYNTQSGQIQAIADFVLNQLAYYTLVEVLPFHNFGEKKYEELGLTYEFKDQKNCTVEELAEPIRILKEAGLQLKIPKW